MVSIIPRTQIVAETENAFDLVNKILKFKPDLVPLNVDPLSLRNHVM